MATKRKKSKAVIYSREWDKLLANTISWMLHYRNESKNEMMMILLSAIERGVELNRLEAERPQKKGRRRGGLLNPIDRG